MLSSAVEEPQARFELSADSAEQDDEEIPPWTEEDVVMLHWDLLRNARTLARADCALEEKIDILRWVFAEAALQSKPFSFESCIRVVSNSPLSPLPYIGKVDADEIRHWIRTQLRRWFDETFARYPTWVRDAILQRPAHVARCLEKNPQWLNQQLRQHGHGDDLFS